MLKIKADVLYDGLKIPENSKGDINISTIETGNNICIHFVAFDFNTVSDEVPEPRKGIIATDRLLYSTFEKVVLWLHT